MKKSPSRAAIAGITGGVLILGTYLACTFISWSLYPSAFSPLTNMISHLGDAVYNPNGAAWFNVGNILTGIGMVPFFIGFKLWYLGDKNQVFLVKLAQIAGFVDAFAVIMIGLIPENLGLVHGYWAGFYFITNSLVLTLSYFAFRNHPQFPKLFSKTWLIVIVLYYLNAVALGFSPLAEWLAVFSGLALAAILVVIAVRTLKMLSVPA